MKVILIAIVAEDDSDSDGDTESKIAKVDR